MLNQKKSENMTEKEIEMAKYIKDDVLPKLQEMQRDLYFDQHITMSVATSDPYFGVDVWLSVKEDRAETCGGNLALECFLLRTYEDRENNDNTLEKLRELIEKWQARLG